MSSPQWLALAAAALFGLAHTLSRFGLRYVPPRIGASISVPTTALLFWLAAPFALDLRGLSWPAVGWFALIGVFFPAAVTILNFESTRRMGPTISSAVGATSAAFALLTALLFLGESLTWLIVLGTATIIAGVALLSWSPARTPRAWAAWMLLIPLSAAAIRGNAQTLSKYALSLWSNPFAASLIGYTVSALILLLASLGPRRAHGRIDRGALPWLAGVGFCNGTGLFLTYVALQTGKVGVVAPIVTTAPVFTLLANALLLREERIGAPMVVAVLLTVSGVIMILTH